MREDCIAQGGHAYIGVPPVVAGLRLPLRLPDTPAWWRSPPCSHQMHTL